MKKAIEKNKVRNTERAELLAVNAAAAVLSISARHLLRLCEAGDAPAPLRLGGSVRWRRAELNDWMNAGCPSPQQTGWTWQPSK